MFRTKAKTGLTKRIRDYLHKRKLNGTDQVKSIRVLRDNAPCDVLLRFPGMFKCIYYSSLMLLLADALNAYDGGVRAVTGATGTAGIWTNFPADYLGIGNGLLDQVKNSVIGLRTTVERTL